MLRKTAAVAVSLTSIMALSAGTAAAFGSKSTTLSNGVLTITADDGCSVSGNCTLYYSATTYKKTGGGTVSIELAMSTSDALYKAAAVNISSGQTKTHSWGGKAKSQVSDCDITGYMVASTGSYYTPPVDVC
ncbi:hypothetical protein [Streptomyces sp. NBC_01237]|uniref:hypothetical protein n=1 Tax=Streptomyces sp. NBC_01237 TaxID=2903790 RepID=UPI002DDA418F|nr:hypothetical protein [Streptomyces sp. NBC_01237]WRZ76404.1 hypothetical protein OG251_34955 [Streptomyces sp. NBC_01237]